MMIIIIFPFFFQYVVYFTKLFYIPFPLKDRRKLTFLGRRVIFTKKVEFKSEQILICALFKHYLTPMRYSQTDR